MQHDALRQYLESQKSKSSPAVVKVQKIGKLKSEWKHYTKYDFDSKSLYNLNSPEPIKIPYTSVIDFGKSEDYQAFLQEKAQKKNKKKKVRPLAGYRNIDRRGKDRYEPSIRDINASRVDNSAPRDGYGGDITGYGRKKSLEFNKTLAWLSEREGKTPDKLEITRVGVTDTPSPEQNRYKVFWKTQPAKKRVVLKKNKKKRKASQPKKRPDSARRAQNATTEKDTPASDTPSVKAERVKKPKKVKKNKKRREASSGLSQLFNKKYRIR